MIFGARHAGLPQVKVNDDVGVEVGSDEDIAGFCLELVIDLDFGGARVRERMRSVNSCSEECG